MASWSKRTSVLGKDICINSLASCHILSASRLISTICRECSSPVVLASLTITIAASPAASPCGFIIGYILGYGDNRPGLGAKEEAEVETLPKTCSLPSFLHFISLFARLVELSSWGTLIIIAAFPTSQQVLSTVWMLSIMFPILIKFSWVSVNSKKLLVTSWFKLSCRREFDDGWSSVSWLLLPPSIWKFQ